MGMPIIKPEMATPQQAIGDIIESITMEETALAHILNAESEKLMSVIQNPNATAAQIVAMNQSVKSTVQAITRLEGILQAKLELFQPEICQQTELL